MRRYVLNNLQASHTSSQSSLLEAAFTCSEWVDQLWPRRLSPTLAVATLSKCAPRSCLTPCTLGLPTAGSGQRGTATPVSPGGSAQLANSNAGPVSFAAVGPARLAGSSAIGGASQTTGIGFRTGKC
jgi:hypothetical protein